MKSTFQKLKEFVTSAFAADRRRKPRAGFRPQLENLEGRVLLADFTWVGGQGINWFDAGNWRDGSNSPGIPETVNDTATIGANARVVLNVDLSVAAVNVTGGGTLRIPKNRSLTVVNAVSVTTTTHTAVLEVEGNLTVDSLTVNGAHATLATKAWSTINVAGTASIQGWARLAGTLSANQVNFGRIVHAMGNLTINAANVSNTGNFIIRPTCSEVMVTGISVQRASFGLNSMEPAMANCG